MIEKHAGMKGVKPIKIHNNSSFYQCVPAYMFFLRHIKLFTDIVSWEWGVDVSVQNSKGYKVGV